MMYKGRIYQRQRVRCKILLGCGDLCSSSKGLTKENMTGLGGCFRLKMLWVCKAGAK